MMTKGEANAYQYEFILKRAFGIGVGNDDGTGPHMADLRNLYWYEDPKARSYVSHLKEKDIREHLRKTMKKGLDKVAKWKLNPEERELVDLGSTRVSEAHTADEFWSIAQLLHDATKRFLSHGS